MENPEAERKIEFFKRKLILWGKENFAEFPWRYTRNHWHALVAEIMLQRTRADQVEPVFVEFTKKYERPSDYLMDNQSAVFANLGLHWREELLKQLAQELSTSEIPSYRQELLSLPGIGDYIASAYRSMHLNLKDRIIDSNVVRIYGRFFGFDTDPETRRKKWFIELAEQITPKHNHRIYNYALIDFTREICRPKPLCDICPIRKRCVFTVNG